VTERHEFCSAAWLDELRHYMTKAVADLGDEVDGVQFALAEVFTGAPPHLALPGDERVGWWLAIDGRDVQVGLGIRDDIERTTTADYETTVPIARTIYSEDPDAAEAARKRHAERVERGELPATPIPPVLLPALMGLHDHLARRTR
jgi:hypothetical protein